jgi:hypothetical protein
MKMLRNILIGTASVVAFAAVGSSALAASTTGVVNATLIQPITITNTAALNWGTIVRPGTGSCNVTMDNAGARTGSTCQLIGGGANAAAFDVTGDGNRSFSIATDATVTLITDGGGDATKEIVYTPASAASGNTGGSNGTPSTVSIPVYGSIVVNNNDVAGAYTGSVTVTVLYN